MLAGLILLAALNLQGCLRSPVPAPPEFTGLSVTAYPLLAGCDLVRWSPDSTKIAAACSGQVRVVSMADAAVLWSAPARGEFAWSVDGQLLAVLQSADPAGRLTIYASDGTRLEVLSLPDVVTSLDWEQSGGLLLFAYHLEQYRFGSNLKQLLYRYQDQKLRKLATVSDVTLKPSTWSRYGAEIAANSRLLTGPLGDVVVYPVYRDPPAFEGYFSLYARHLVSGKSWRVVKTIPVSGALLALPGHDSLLVGDTLRQTRELNLWTGATTPAYALPGLSLQVSADGRNQVIDGRWYQDDRLTWQLPTGSSIVFSATSRSALVSHGKHDWFLVKGLRADPLTRIMTGKERLHLLKIRRWLSSGLIDPDEYQQLKKGQP